MVDEEESQSIKFVKMLNQYEKLVFSICYRMTNNYFDSEDLTQETFLSVYKSMDTFDGGNEKAFITRIATNKCLDYLKRAERRTKPGQEVEIERGSPPTDSAERKVMEIVVMERLLDCCKKLKKPYNKVAYSYFYEGKTAREIAEATETNLNTVQTQIQRIRKELKKQWSKEELQ